MEKVVEQTNIFGDNTNSGMPDPSHMKNWQNTDIHEMLALTLRFLATGESYRSLMFSTRIHESTISLIVPEVCKVIYQRLKDEYMKMPQTVSEWQQVASDFENLWQFPMCLGAIDGKHINFRAPRSSGSYFYNYKGQFSYSTASSIKC
ncbi:uncharacterized protein [Diabrotica undecimpunctata]|uniref:uncharacterized protein n=1 Tax=Diabrotica undecimpunctata TaxID=50387 RepID=UPI003B63910C